MLPGRNDTPFQDPVTRRRATTSTLRVTRKGTAIRSRLVDNYIGNRLMSFPAISFREREFDSRSSVFGWGITTVAEESFFQLFNTVEFSRS